jgi:DNA-binding response OmpR family regulator
MISNRVLVVEDDPSVRGLIQAILEAEVADPLRRELGPDAVLEKPFDVVTLADRVRALAERGPAARGHGAHVAER